MGDSHHSAPADCGQAVIWHRVAGSFFEFSRGISQHGWLQWEQRGTCLMARLSPQATSLPPPEKQFSLIHSNNYKVLP